MNRLAPGLTIIFLCQTWQAPARAADPVAPAAAEPQVEAPAAEGAAVAKDPAAAPAAGAAPAVAPVPGDALPAVQRTGWEDVVVVPRKAVLKAGRFELNPFSGVSINDLMIRHYAFGADLNYFLSDVLSVGVQGQYFIKSLTDSYRDVGLRYNRLSTLNKYDFSAAVNFGYVPGYGKFTLFNKYILHWELIASGGVGMIRSEIIPRRAGDSSFSSNRIAANFGVGTRFFLSNWLTFNISMRDYIFNDLVEPGMRVAGESGNDAKKRASSQFTNSIMLYAGIGVYLPLSFQYRTPR